MFSLTFCHICMGHLGKYVQKAYQCPKAFSIRLSQADYSFFFFCNEKVENVLSKE